MWTEQSIKIHLHLQLRFLDLWQYLQHCIKYPWSGWLGWVGGVLRLANGEEERKAIGEENEEGKAFGDTTNVPHVQKIVYLMAKKNFLDAFRECKTTRGFGYSWVPNRLVRFWVVNFGSGPVRVSNFFWFSVRVRVMVYPKPEPPR